MWILFLHFASETTCEDSSFLCRIPSYVTEYSCKYFTETKSNCPKSCGICTGSCQYSWFVELKATYLCRIKLVSFLKVKSPLPCFLLPYYPEVFFSQHISLSKQQFSSKNTPCQHALFHRNLMNACGQLPLYNEEITFIEGLVFISVWYFLLYLCQGYCSRVESYSRQQCGSSGTTASQCHSRGCCWNPTYDGSGTPWCFSVKSGLLQNCLLFSYIFFIWIA